MAVLLFVPAGGLGYWQAWAFLAAFGTPSLAITLYLLRKDRRLLERRLKAGPLAEKGWQQKVIQSITATGFVAMLVVPALDHRFAWSAIPAYLSVLGDCFVAFGFFIIFLVYRENPFAWAIIDVTSDQKVVSSGLYKLVRHPMYMGGLIFLLGMPVSLASWWAMLILLLLVPAIIWRALDEEKLLTKNLQGYAEYKDRVRYRLLPFVW